MSRVAPISNQDVNLSSPSPQKGSVGKFKTGMITVDFGNLDHETSQIDLDLEKRSTTISYEHMIRAFHENHAFKNDGSKYTTKEACCKTDVGYHKCFTSPSKSQLVKFGVGIVLYFKFMKRLIHFFLLFAILSIPMLAIFIGSYLSQNQVNTFTYQDILSATTLGSIGLGAFTCDLAENIGGNLYFYCGVGELTSEANLIYGLVDAGDTCDVIEQDDIDFSCNTNDASTLANTYGDECEGKTECDITVSSSLFKSSDSTCNAKYDSKNIYMQASCNTESINIGGNDVNKVSLAYAIVWIDIIIVCVYVFMVWSLGYVQIDATKHILKIAYSASNYSITISGLPQHLSPEDCTVELWNLIQRRLNKKNKSFKVIDVQIIVPNKVIYLKKQIGDIMNEKNNLIRDWVELYYKSWKDDKITFSEVTEEMQKILKTKAKDYRAARSLYKKISKLVQQKAKKIQEIRKISNEGKTALVGAFVTLNTFAARKHCLELMNGSPIDRCCRRCCKDKVDADVFFHNHQLIAKDADEPGNILWENLGESVTSIFLRRFSSFILTLILWVGTGAVVAVATTYKNSFASEYPKIDCSTQDPSLQQASDDYAQGELQIGLLECYCSTDFSGRLNVEFPDHDNATLCFDFYSDRVLSYALTFAIVFCIVLINFIMQNVFTLLSQFERHKSLTQQLSSRVIKIFIAQFLNTGIIILLINAKFEGVSFWQGRFSDQVPLWYVDVGAVIISTMIINVFSVPVAKLSGLIIKMMLRCCDRKCGCDPRVTRKKTQKAYENLYTNPEFLLDFRYAQVLTLVFVTFMYSSCMPLLYTSALLQLIFSFYQDKYLLLKTLRLPKNYDEKLEYIVRQTMYIIVIFHMFFAIWVYGVKDIFNTESEETSNLSETLSSLTSNIDDAESGVVSEFFTRIIIGWNIVMFIALLVVLVVFLLRGGLLTFFKRTICSLCTKNESDEARKNTTISPEKDKKRLKGGKKMSFFSKIKQRRKDITFFEAIGSEEIGTLIKLSKYKKQEAQSEKLKEKLQEKIEMYKTEYEINKANEAAGNRDQDLNFIGLTNYNIELAPKYKKEFEIDKYLDDHDLN